MGFLDKFFGIEVKTGDKLSKSDVLTNEWYQFLMSKVSKETGAKKMDMRQRVFEEWIIKKIAKE
jgi:hypothetical protein